MFNIPPEVFMIGAPLIMFAAVIDMVRRRQLREDYSLLWLVTFGVLVVLAIFHDTLLDLIAKVLGIFYPPMALFVISFGMMLVVMLQFSKVITRLARENKQAAQSIALLSARIKELERQLEDKG